MLADTQSTLDSYLDTLEQTPLWTRWQRGTISADTYASVLKQLYHLHLAFEIEMGERDPLDVFSVDLIQSDVLRGDLYVLSRSTQTAPLCLPAVKVMVEHALPSWSLALPERMLAVTWFLESLRRRMLRLFGGSVMCLSHLPGDNRGLAYMRQPLGEYQITWNILQRHFASRLEACRHPNQVAVGLIHVGELMDHVFHEVAPDLHATRR